MDELQKLRLAFECCFRDLANNGLVPRPDQEAIDAAFVLFVADMARGFPSLTEGRPSFAGTERGRASHEKRGAKDCGQ
jgi:hypothetical protein